MDMTEPDFTALGERVDSLEREVRRWRIAGGAVLVGLALVLVMGATIIRTGEVFDEVRSKSFVLVDEKRIHRALLRILDDGSSSLTLHDSAGRIRVALAAYEDRPALTLIDAAGQVRAALRLKPDEAPSLALLNAAGKARAEFRLDPAGAPAFHLFGLKGGEIAGLEPMGDGSPGFALVGSDGNTFFSAPLR
jgi:hypothetical protein